jgi:XRE family transcriptional regulator, regulator of sulfur utilization
MPMSLTPKRPMAGTDVSSALIYCGTVLRQAREQQGLTLEEMAAHAGISKSYIAMFEMGQRDLSLGRILRLARVLEVPFADLLPPADPSVLGRLLLHIQARGPAWAQSLLALHEAPMPCPKRRR